jgi:Flp pilus assembly protein TadG
MMIRLRKLFRDRRGTAVLELALVAPVLAVFVIGIADISTAFSRKLELEQAAQRAVEKIMQTTGEDTAEGTIKTEAVCQFNGVNEDGTCKTTPIDTDDVTVTYRLECDGVVTDYTLDCAEGETEARYIMAEVDAVYTPMFPIHFATSDDGKYHLRARAGVRVQ